MSNLVYPSLPGLVFPIRRRPKYSTAKTEALSGKESRIRLQRWARITWDLEYEFLRDPSSGTSELKQLVGLFDAVAGDWDTFLYTDPEFNTVTDEPFGTGDGTTTAFQLIATYQNAGGPGGATLIQNVNGSPSIKKAGVPQSAPTNYTLDSLGVVTFTSAPSAGQALTWSGSFYFRCRFDLDDELDVEKFMQQLWSAGSVTLKQVKL